MKMLRSVALGFALALFVPVLAIAQMDFLKNSTPEERATKLTDMMKSELSLDEKTTAAVADINLKYAKEAQTLMDSSGTQFGKIMTFRKNEEAKDAELKEVLSPGQYSQYEEKKSEMREAVKQKLEARQQSGQ